jgi:hypothetical protein
LLRFKINRHFDKKIFLSSKYFSKISKYFQTGINRSELSKINIFNTHRKKILDVKCLFIAISFYLFIAILCAKIAKISSVYKP